MRKDYLLENGTAVRLYEKARSMPILDYHCHLSAKEILEDKVFDNIGEMWLSGDHYKWRLMRQAGVAEEFITGKASWRDKFKKYAGVISMSGGNPLYAWSKMELSMYFGIDRELTEEDADSIFDEANSYIKEHSLSPRKLIKNANVIYIATTDDPADSLEYHVALHKERDFPCFIAPAFRPDPVFNIHKGSYKEYIDRLSEASEIEITDIDSLSEALSKRLKEFIPLGCSFSDCGIDIFPSENPGKEVAGEIFAKALKGGEISLSDRENFAGYLFDYLAAEYKKLNITMQLHLSAKREANSLLVKTAGADCGSDCTGDSVSCEKLSAFLDRLEKNGNLPKTVIYTLNPSMEPMLASLCGSFRDVIPGAAWWFCDHKNGIRRTMENIAEESYFPAFLGMLTDSRSFLSYARHDYFRRILCTLLGEWCEKDDFPEASSEKILEMICLKNIYDRVLPGVKTAGGKI